MISTENFSEKYHHLYKTIYDLYHLPGNKNKLLFHGWHHIKFVHNKALEFGKDLKANLELVAVAAILHDLNFIFSDTLGPEGGKEKIVEFLEKSGYEKDIVTKVTEDIISASVGNRGNLELNTEAKALADADTLFKALPTTPILFASKYITQNNYDIRKLADKIVEEQAPLLEKNTYFYSDLAKNTYLEWAKTNLALWKNVKESLEDKNISEMLQTAKELGIL